MSRRPIVAVVLSLFAALGVPGSAVGAVRLAAPEDCLTNPNCGVGLESSYGLDVSSLFVPLAAADEGIAALDDGDAEVAVAFSSSPAVSRPDVLTLRDDRHMVGEDHVVPVIRRSLLRRYGRRGRDIRRRLTAASRELGTLDLRGLNQQLEDGGTAADVGAGFVDANGLSGTGGHRRRGPRITIGHMAFAENAMLAQLYAEVLRTRGYRVRVRSTGLRPQTVAAMRAGKIDLWPGYSGSLREYLARGSHRSIGKLLERIGARALTPAPAENKNLFVMKTDVAAQYHVSKLSDLAAYWPAATGG
jgi:glycine betaine/choline ABC-type transport system substrate-binding protein